MDMYIYLHISQTPAPGHSCKLAPPLRYTGPVELLEAFREPLKINHHFGCSPESAKVALWVLKVLRNASHPSLKVTLQASK